MKKPILISGIQPSGRLHIGNYLGALKNFVELQNSGKYRCYFFIADYHSLTEDFSAEGGPASGWEPTRKSKQILDLVKSYLAAGINPKKSPIFIQSQVPQATELAWILNTITPMGELRRMTQFKDKSESQPENINAGLFTYPVLMAADVILYDAAFVPVGEDQLQHLELTRTITRKFNNKFGKSFVEPQPVITRNARIMSLSNPEKKMSKSQPQGCLFLDDSESDIETKIKTAVTDSESEVKYNLQTKAGISNLMDIYSAFSGKSTQEIEKIYVGKGYGSFKSDLAKIISESLKPFRARKISDSTAQKAVSDGAKKAQKIANVKMKFVKRKIGLSF